MKQIARSNLMHLASITLLALGLILVGPAAANAETIFTPIQPADDFFVTSYSNGLGHFFPSNGDGSLGAVTPSTDIGNAVGVDIADMDGDGDNDILLCASDGRIYLFANDGYGSFVRSTASLEGFPFSTYLRTGDFNEDGRNDFVVGSVFPIDGVFVYLQDETGAFERVLPGLDMGILSGYGSQAEGLTIGDADGDGHLDVLILGHWGPANNRLVFFKGDGSGGMAPPVQLHQFNFQYDGLNIRAATGITLFDYEGDGDLDLVIGGSSYPLSDYYVLENDGQGNFALPSEWAFQVYGGRFGGQSVIDVCDFDKDGDHDLIVATLTSQTIYHVENLGGAFADPIIVGYSNGFIQGVGASPVPVVKAADPTEMIEELAAEILTVPADYLPGHNQANALGNKFQSILDELNAIDEDTPEADKIAIYTAALDKLEKDILKKMDGFYGGNPKNDWIVTQEGQDAFYPKVKAVIDALEAAIEG